MAATWREDRPDATTAASHSAERPSRFIVTISSALSSSSDTRMRFSKSLSVGGAATFFGTGLGAGFLTDFFTGFGAGFLTGFFADFLAGAFLAALAFCAFAAGFLAAAFAGCFFLAFRGKVLCGQGVRFSTASA